MKNVIERLKELKREKEHLLNVREQLIQQLSEIDRNLIKMEGGEFELENLLKEKD